MLGFGLIIVILWSLQKLFSLCKWGRKVYTYCMGKLVFNSLLRCIIQVYFSCCLALFSNVHIFDRNQASDEVVNIIVSCIIVLIIVIFPIANAWFLRKRMDTLYKKSTRETYGSLYLDMRTYDARALYWTSIFLARRIIQAATIIWIDQIVF